MRKPGPCRVCGEQKKPDDYYWYTEPRNGRVRPDKACKDCRKLENRLRPYGLTKDEYEAMLLRQGGLCGVCRSSPARCIDHCHESGRVRAILCHRCNWLLGQVGDDPD